MEKVLESMIQEKELEWARNFIARELNEGVLSDENEDNSKEKIAEMKKNIDAATFNIVSIEKDVERLKRFLKAQKG